MVGLGMHALLEGLPLGTAGEMSSSLHEHTHMDGDHLLVGIVLHKIPAAFALGLLLRHSGYSSRFTWGCLLLFGLLSPLGAVLGEVISIDPVWRNRVLALVIGSFLHISTTILFEADGDRNHGISAKKFAVACRACPVTTKLFRYSKTKRCTSAIAIGAAPKPAAS
jgi:zinc transporter ZupT